MHDKQQLHQLLGILKLDKKASYEAYNQLAEANRSHYNLLLDLLFFKQNQEARQDNKGFKADRFNQEALVFDFIGIHNDVLLNTIFKCLHEQDFSANQEFFKQNTTIILGLMIYYAKSYDLFMFALLLGCLLVFNSEAYQHGANTDAGVANLIEQHLQFIKTQRKKDGKVGFINPLLKLNSDTFDPEAFYLINELSLITIEKILAYNLRV